MIKTSREIGGSLGLAVLLTGGGVAYERADGLRISGGRDRGLHPAVAASARRIGAT